MQGARVSTSREDAELRAHELGLRAREVGELQRAADTELGSAGEARGADFRVGNCPVPMYRDYQWLF